MKKTLHFLFSRWYLGLFVVAVILLGISYILRFFTPPIPIQDNSWQGLTPGYGLPKNISETLGAPLDSKNVDGQTQYTFKSDIPIQPQEVVVDKAGKVSFIREYTLYDPKETVQKYSSQYGEPDITTYESSLPEADLLYVFLKKGVALVAHAEGGTIEQKWYFKPTDADTLLKTIGKDATTEYPGPETLIQTPAPDGSENTPTP